MLTFVYQRTLSVVELLLQSLVWQYRLKNTAGVESKPLVVVK